MKITIIGGGVNGLCSAYYLVKEGYQVEIIDESFSESGTSYGNAGMIVPSHFMPMASPGVIAKGIKWMFDSSSPFYVKPRIDFRLMQWLYKFYKSCNETNVAKSQELIWQYNELSKSEYRTIASDEKLEFDFHEQGLMMLYKNDKSQKEEISIGEKAQKLGLEVQFLDEEGVQKLNPNTRVNVKGGVYYPGDAHLYSNFFMGEMKKLLITRGVNFITKKIISGTTSSNKITNLKCEDGSIINTDQLVITAGTWTWQILQKLGLKLLLEDGKGYSITKFDTNQRPTIPSILTHEKVAITPMGNNLRITGTLEISGISNKINAKRVNGFLNAVPKYFPEINVSFPSDEKEIWTGFRPLSPDGVPYVGRSEKLNNLIVATGHGMMGMSLGPATGKLVSEIVAGKESSLDLSLLSLER